MFPFISKFGPIKIFPCGYSYVIMLCCLCMHYNPSLGSQICTYICEILTVILLYHHFIQQLYVCSGHNFSCGSRIDSMQEIEFTYLSVPVMDYICRW